MDKVKLAFIAAICLLFFACGSRAGKEADKERSAGSEEAVVEEAVEAQGAGGVFTDDRDGKTYKSVKIGNQVWMAENLNFDAGGSKCYNNDSENCKKYGRLYSWDAARAACPSGWHLPGDSEWDALMVAIGGFEAAGKHLKAKSGWNWHNYYNKSGNGSDTYGFAAMPGGYGWKADFIEGGDNGFWWSSSEADDSSAISRYIYNGYETVFWGDSYKKLLVSVRCALINERGRKGAAELIAADPAPVLAELEQAAKRWQDSTSIIGRTEGRFFVFEAIIAPSHCYDCGTGPTACWKAASKVKIGECPSGSIWTMHNGNDHGEFWGHDIPPKCKSVTPQIIANYKGEVAWGEGECGWEPCEEGNQDD